MKIVQMVKKDLKLFSRDVKTITLIIFTPLIVMLILSIVFSTASRGSAVTGVTLGVCNLDDQEFDIDLPIFQISKIEGDDCARYVQSQVERGYLKAALVIPPRFTKNIEEGFGSELILFVDNSKSQTAIVSSNAIKALVQELNEEVGITFIESAWDNLRALNANLKLVVANLVLLRDELSLINEEVNNVTETLSSVNFSAVDAAFDEVSQNVNDSLVLVNNSLGAIDQVEAEFLILNNSLLTVEEIYDENCVVQNNFPFNTCESLNKSVSGLRESYDRVVGSSALGRTNLELLKENINRSQDLLNNVSAQIARAEDLRAELQADLARFNASINAYNQQILDTIDELEGTTELLDIYTSRNPKNIVSAVSLEENFIHGEKSFFEILVPGILSILLLFIILLTASLDIVAERKRGTMARTFLSPTAIFTFLTAKVLYLLILALVELAVMLIIAFFFTKFLVITGAMLWLLGVISVLFVLLGILIGTFAKSENTALLLSLVLAIPMLFLSGVFFPFEIMPNFMKAIGANLPLTLAVNSLEKIMIYRTTLVFDDMVKMIVYSVLLFIIAYFIIKKDPTS